MGEASPAAFPCAVLRARGRGLGLAYVEGDLGFLPSEPFGCHQWAGPLAAGTGSNPVRLKERQNFATDFLWSYDDRNDSVRNAILNVVGNRPSDVPETPVAAPEPSPEVPQQSGDGA